MRDARDAMGVLPDIAEGLLWSGEGRLGADHRFRRACGRQIVQERGPLL
jgi:hypothetical protein